MSDNTNVTWYIEPHTEAKHNTGLQYERCTIGFANL